MVLTRTETIIKYYNLIADKDINLISEIPERQLNILRSTEVSAMQHALAIDFISRSKNEHGRGAIRKRFSKVSFGKIQSICRQYRLPSG